MHSCLVQILCLEGKKTNIFFYFRAKEKKKLPALHCRLQCRKKKINLLLLPFHLLRPQQMQINILKLLSREEEADGHKRHLRNGSAPLAF